MGWLKHLRWKLFVSHLLIIVIGVIVLLATAHFLAGSQLGQEAQLSLGQAAAETGQLAPGTPPAPAPTQQERFQAVTSVGVQPARDTRRCRGVFPGAGLHTWAEPNEGVTDRRERACGRGRRGRSRGPCRSRLPGDAT